LFERLNEMDLLLPRCDGEVAYPVHSRCRLLRTCSQRLQRCPTAKKRDELPPLHCRP
jgi:hypothetical protein